DRPRLGADQGPGADQPREQQGPAPVPEPGDRRERLHRLLGGPLPRLLQVLFRARADPPAAETRPGSHRNGLTPSLVIPILEPLVHLLGPIAVASLMAAVAAGLGTLARGRPRGEESRWGEAGLNLALGLALLSALGFWLGLAGCLRRCLPRGASCDRLRSRPSSGPRPAAGSRGNRSRLRAPFDSFRRRPRRPASRGGRSGRRRGRRSGSLGAVGRPEAERDGAGRAGGRRLERRARRARARREGPTPRRALPRG